MANEKIESYWRGVQCRVEGIHDELRQIWELLSKPMTSRSKEQIRSAIRNIDEYNSCDYRECENLVSELTDDEIIHRDDIPEAMKYIPPATRLSILDFDELVEALKNWRERIGLPREAY